MTHPTVCAFYAEAYAIKESSGGGFRGVAVNKLTKEQKKGERRESIEQARHDAKTFVFEFAAGRNMTTGAYKGSRTNWKYNYFIRSDEA
jgi:hypothetical protein